MSALKHQMTAAFNAYAREGAQRWQGDAKPAVLSHVCLKFTTLDAYARYVAAARELGVVTQEIFKGKEITWCRLAQPLEGQGQRLEWLELVEPRLEQQGYDGVANIGYSVAGLPEAVRLVSQDAGMTFRYQSQHAAQMAPRA